MASDKAPARNKTSYYANQLSQSLSDSSVVNHSLPLVYGLLSQSQSTPAIHNGTLDTTKTLNTATTLNQRALQSSSSLSQQALEVKHSIVDESGKDGSLTEIAKDIEENVVVETESKSATNRTRDPENQHDDSTTRGVELPVSQPGPGGPQASVLKRWVSSHRSCGTQKFSSSASTPTIQPVSATSATPKSLVPKIKLHQSDATEDWYDGLDHATSSTGLRSPIENSGISTPSGKGDESFFTSSLLLGDGIDSDSDSRDGFDADPDSQDDSRALVPISPAPTPHRRSVSSDLICSTPPGGLNVIWNWVISKRREKHVQPFFWIAIQLCRTLVESDIPTGFVYAFKVTDPQGRGYVKIGVTKGRLVTRMNAHSFCYGGCEQIYPPPDEKPAPVNHARRIEQLVHAELVEHSISLEKCPRARQRHNCHGEWFDVSPRHAINVIRKWSEWMSGNPYVKRSVPAPKSKRNSVGEARKTAWQLGILPQDVITRICWPTATTVDDDGETSELGKGIRLLTFG